MVFYDGFASLAMAVYHFFFWFSVIIIRMIRTLLNLRIIIRKFFDAW